MDMNHTEVSNKNISYKRVVEDTPTLLFFITKYSTSQNNLVSGKCCVREEEVLICFTNEH